jgi:glycosyltransferase involved in cell wall biosynthesis
MQQKVVWESEFLQEPLAHEQYPKPPKSLGVEERNPIGAQIGLSVIMPCHNEASIARQSVEETLSALRLQCDRSFEIVVVDDGSTDGTSEQIRDLAGTHPEVRIVRLQQNSGKGNALRTAFPFTEGELVCFLDGDLDFHPRHILPFVRILEAEHCDIVVGSKRHPESKIDYPVERRALSIAYELLVRTLLDLHVRDSQAGIKLFRRDVLARVFPKGLVKRYAYDAELLAVATRLGYRIREAPVTMNFRDKFGSGVDLIAIVKMFMDTVGIFYRLKVTHYYSMSDAPERRLT